MTYGSKCCTAAAMGSALRFSLKKPVMLPGRVTSYVAAIPGFLTAPSVTINSLSSDFGRVIEREVESAFLAVAKASYSSSGHERTSADERPEIPWSIGERRDEQAAVTRASTSYAPMNDIMAPSFSNGEHEDNTAIWYGMAVSVPCDQVLPRIVVHFGLIIGL